MTSFTNEQPDEPEQSIWPGEKNATISNWLARRTADQQAAFFLPHLHPGMDLLDCGCGPGSITVGLARYVAPGQVVGIDLDANKIEMAQNQIADQEIPNLRFETADIHKLPFADGSFDAIFSNAVLHYSQEPMVALREMYRVLKHGGMIAIRSSDYDGHLFTPTNPVLMRWWELVVDLQVRKGSNPYLGKHQRALLQQAGFVNVQVSATYECYGTEETSRSWGNVVASSLREDSQIEQFIESGAEHSEIEEMSKAWQEWGENPDAVFADSYVETIGWKS
jgi:ubiquinone/menaquinone biosynthesis C-methylase UbiE